MGKWKWTILSAMLVCGLGLSAPSFAEEAEGTDLVPAEEAGWELEFTDEFDREELGDNWKVFEGSWEIEDGDLVGSGTLVSAEGIPGQDLHRTLPGTDPPGFLRMEFWARTDVQPFTLLPGAPPPKVSVSDLSSFIHAKPYDPDADERPTRTGYFFQFGGFLNTQNRIRRAGVAVVEDMDPKILITPDKLHHIVVENDEGTLSLYVDGHLLLRHKEQMSVMGDGFDRVGFYFYTKARIESVKVYVKRLTDGYI